MIDQRTGEARPPDFTPLTDYVQRLLGARFDGNRGVHLLATLRAAMERRGITEPAQYLGQLQADPTALDELVAATTVGETYFFRHTEQLSQLTERILPELARDRSVGRPLQLWTAGCATGEEAYTLAMLAEDAGLPRARILATDVSSTALAKAAAAVYRPWSLRGDRCLEGRFERVGDLFRVPHRIVSRVELRRLNLLHDPYPDQVDVILCRNVLMYMTPAHIREVARRLAAALAPGGWLITAPADPELNLDRVLEPVRTPAGVMYRAPGESGRRSLLSDQVPTLAPETVTAAGAPAARPSSPPPDPIADGAGMAAALLAMDSGDHDAAAAQAQAVLAAGDDSPATHAVWARALGNAGRTAAAERVAAAAATMFPLDAELRYLHAELLIEAGDPEGAVRQATAAVYLGPNLGVAHLVLGRAELARGRAGPARRAFSTAGKLLDLAAGEDDPTADAVDSMAGYAAAYERMARKRAGTP